MWGDAYTMNYIFTFFILLAVIFSFFTKTEGEIFKVISNSTADCAFFVLKLMAVTAFFSGMIKVAEDSGCIQKLSFLINIIVKKLFKTKGAIDKISLNITANMIGIGNAATPLGLYAMKELDMENKKRDTPSYDMCKFIIFNTCSVQLIPSTILGLRAIADSHNPAIIILPVIITSILSLICGLLICKALYPYKIKDGH